GQKEPAAFRHEDGVAHYRKVSAAGHAHAHNRGDLRNAHGGHYGVVAKNAAKIVSIGEHIFLQGKKDPGGIHQVDSGDMVFDGDVLRANDLFGGHREECAGFDGGVVHDHHVEPAVNAAQTRYHSGRGRASPFFIHLVS